jgi:exopolyphosphatase / guanosine-5'-triphosphate,3'-diphosphate pyrophosphatase
MRVAVIDVGSNTARLLVAEPGRRGAEPVGAAKAYLGLGEEILRHGEVTDPKLAETAATMRRFMATGRELGAGSFDVFVTAPGRQAANAEALVAAIARSTGQVVRVLSAEEEGLLAFEGALASTRVDVEKIAVCDVGGGSTELIVGGLDGAEWNRSVDVGSLRLTAALLPDDPPTAEQVQAAERYVAEQFAVLEPPPVEVALAVGGSARALARITDGVLSEKALGKAVELAAGRRSDKLARRENVDPARARTLAGGALILREVGRRVGTPFQLGRGGIREGAVARLLERRDAA